MTEENVGNYLNARNYSIESLSYVWEQTKPQIESLLSDNEKLLQQNSFDYIKSAYDLLSDGVIQSIIEEKDRELKTIESIKKRETIFFNQVVKALPDIFNDLFYSYLENTQYSQRDEHISKLARGFAKYNVDLRYPSIASNPPTNPRTGFPKEWQFEKINELLQCYDGVVSLVQSVRNLSSHFKETATKRLLTKLGREVIEPVSSSNSPGNIFVLTSIVIVIIHEFREVLQTWKDTAKLRGSP